MVRPGGTADSGASAVNSAGNGRKDAAWPALCLKLQVLTGCTSDDRTPAGGAEAAGSTAELGALHDIF
jgi:hypothetical protein